MTHKSTIPAIASAAADAAIRQIGWSSSEDPFSDPRPTTPMEIADQKTRIDELLNVAEKFDGVGDRPWASQLIDEALADLAQATDKSTFDA